ncbi:MAG: hypothetical protein J2P48_16870 [Alphaproteobacteria bacterium]|nr:hypothetical protein [Alphaproteobacteria bacterium]
MPLRKAAIRLPRLRAGNRRRRLDFHYQKSADLIRRFALIATEPLPVANITRSAKGTDDIPGENVKQKGGLNREILDTARARFLKFVSYKAQRLPRTFPECGAVHKKLDERMHACFDCAYTGPRDAASRVCLNWALKHIEGRESSDAGYALVSVVH